MNPPLLYRHIGTGSAIAKRFSIGFCECTNPQRRSGDARRPIRCRLTSAARFLCDDRLELRGHKSRINEHPLSARARPKAAVPLPTNRRRLGVRIAHPKLGRALSWVGGRDNRIRAKTIWSPWLQVRNSQACTLSRDGDFSGPGGAQFFGMSLQASKLHSARSMVKASLLPSHSPKLEDQETSSGSVGHVRSCPESSRWTCRGRSDRSACRHIDRRKACRTRCLDIIAGIRSRG